MNKLAIALVLGAIFAVGCGDKKEEGASDSGSAKIGIAECDDYFTKMEACISKTPAEGKAGMEAAMKQSRTAWAELAKAGGAAKDGLKTTCKAAADALAANPDCK